MLLSECLPTMYETLGSISSIEEKKWIELYSQMLMFLALKTNSFINGLITW